MLARRVQSGKVRRRKKERCPWGKASNKIAKREKREGESKRRGK